MGTTYTPFRYPGGKSRFRPLLERVLGESGLSDITYVEPFAGGAGAALGLLFKDKVSRVVLNDADPCIAAAWRAILNHREELCDRIRSVSVDLDEWGKQKAVVKGRSGTDIELGFATLFVNRCARSGILRKSGPIGGKGQNGTYRIDARFNRDTLCRKIKMIAESSDHIEFHSLDAEELLSSLGNREDRERLFVYLDPPYYHRGQYLYMNAYDHAGHESLAGTVKALGVPWLMSYDNCDEIRELYAGCIVEEKELYYSAQRRRVATEIIISSAETVRVEQPA